MNLYHDLTAGNEDLSVIHVVVDIPRGSSNKYEYDEEHGYVKLDRVLHSQMFYPFDYGWIPQTLADDGDAVDVCLLTTYPTLPGCVVKARIIGMFETADESGGDDKVLAVPISKVDPRWDEYQSWQDIPQHVQKELLLHFKEIKKLEAHKYDQVKIGEYKSKEETMAMLERAVATYKNKHI